MRDWKPIAMRLLNDKGVILHTDVARAYRLPLRRVAHTAVAHCKKNINGKWVNPHYTKSVNVVCDGRKYWVTMRVTRSLPTSISFVSLFNKMALLSNMLLTPYNAILN